MDITFTIPNDKIDRIVEAFTNLFPIPKIIDPEWVDPGDGSEASMVNEFTDNEWTKECIRQYAINQVKRWEDYRDKKAINNIRDETLIS